MTKKNVHDLRFAGSQNPSLKLPAHERSQQKGMPIVKCVCGFQILVVPDMKAMDLAVERHIEKHAKLSKRFKKKRIAAGFLRQFLTEQILTVTSHINA